MPSSVKGISHSGMIIPTVPFCPALEAILSPMAGILSSLNLIFAVLNPTSPSVINDLSTYPTCPFLVKTDASVYILLFLSIDELACPINTILSFIRVFSLTRPCLSRWL